MNNGVIPISNFQLAMSVILVLVAGGISAGLRLGLLKSLTWGVIRTFVQLTLTGYVLKIIFSENKLWLIALMIIIMCYVAAITSVRRTPNVPQYPTDLAFWSLFTSTVLVGIFVVRVIISPSPWYSARVVIPIFGMILGNSMNGVALALDRLYSEAYARAGEIETLLAFGATPWEAIRDCVRDAIRSGMTPTINSLMVVGIVSLPGMMTGQILGGADPRQAVRYQIVVMLMVAAAVAIGCLLIVGFTYKKLFTNNGALKREILQSRK